MRQKHLKWMQQVEVVMANADMNAEAGLEQLIVLAMEEVEREQSIHPEFKAMAKATLTEFIKSHADSLSPLDLTALVSCWKR